MLKFVAIISLFLLVSGCKSGDSGSGFGSLFSTGSSSGSGESSGSSGFYSGGSSNNGVHTVHNPEPSSMALLATGLAGFAIAQLRKRKKN